MNTRKHVHHEEIDSHGLSECACGRIVQYDMESPLQNRKPPTVIKPGDPNYVDPDKENNRIKTSTKAGIGGGINNISRHKFFSENKHLILADMKNKGVKATLKDRNISYNTWHGRCGLAYQWKVDHKTGLPICVENIPQNKPKTKKISLSDCCIINWTIVAHTMEGGTLTLNLSDINLPKLTIEEFDNVMALMKIFKSMNK